MDTEVLYGIRVRWLDNETTKSSDETEKYCHILIYAWVNNVS